MPVGLSSSSACFRKRMVWKKNSFKLNESILGHIKTAFFIILWSFLWETPSFMLSVFIFIAFESSQEDSRCVSPTSERSWDKTRWFTTPGVNRGAPWLVVGGNFSSSLARHCSNFDDKAAESRERGPNKHPLLRRRFFIQVSVSDAARPYLSDWGSVSSSR